MLGVDYAFCPCIALPNSEFAQRQEDIDMFANETRATKPGEIGIKAPKMANNKRHGKRLKSKKEKATEKKKKKAGRALHVTTWGMTAGIVQTKCMHPMINRL
nr:protein FAR1-RELATED SEQUENCE 5-like [Ipomoea batatas]